MTLGDVFCVCAREWLVPSLYTRCRNDSWIIYYGLWCLGASFAIRRRICFWFSGLLVEGDEDRQNSKWRRMNKFVDLYTGKKYYTTFLNGYIIHYWRFP